MDHYFGESTNDEVVKPPRFSRPMKASLYAKLMFTS